MIEGFIVDFYCEEAKLAIEIDGGIHDDPEQREIDAHREKVFIARGIYTLRLNNQTVTQDLHCALNRIVTVAGSRIKDGPSGNLKSMPC